MIPGDIPRIIKLDFNTNVTFKDGDIVTISVIKPLTTHKWAVGIKGNVVPAFSKVELFPGQKLKAIVVRDGNSFQLKIAANNVALHKDKFSEFLIQQGISVDALSQAIVTSLIKSHLPLDPQMIIKMRNLLGKIRKKPHLLSRVLSILAEKNIDISSGKIEALLDLLDYGEDSGSDHKQETPKRSFKNAEEIKDIVKEIVNKTSDIDENLIQVFNHIKGKNPSWLVIPFRINAEQDVAGTIRILYNSLTKKIEKMTILINQHDDIRIFFHIIEKKNHKKLMIFCNDEEKRELLRKEIKKLSINLQNTDVKIDDNIYMEEDFDGFTPLEEMQQYRRINIQT
ncbi:MAG: hypothetical protein JXJ04_19200 [Spirochaetales bacterium]|nr:hypothetical protein [Spirochaetales bacterium]